MLRVCLVTTFYPPYHFGGDAIFVHRLARALAARGHSVDVVHSVDAYRLSRPDPQPGFEETPGVRRLPLASRFPLGAALLSHQIGGPASYRRQLDEILSPGRYDVIHFHNISLAGGPGVLRCGDGIKLCTAHEYWLVCPTHVLFRYDGKACDEKSCLRCTLAHRRPPQLWRATGLVDDCLRSLDALLLQSRFAIERHRAEGIDAPVRLMPGFVPVPADIASAPTGEVYFLFVGRLEKLKGLQDLVAMLRGFPAARLKIAGSGTYEPELRAMAVGLPNVEFLGQVHPSRVSELYRGALAVVVPSLCFEVFPLAVAEALAFGVPVVARRIGAVAEMVEDSGGGLLFETAAECRAAMERLMASPALRADLGGRGRATAIERWTEDVHMTRYMELIAELQARRPPRVPTVRPSTT